MTSALVAQIEEWLPGDRSPLVGRRMDPDLEAYIRQTRDDNRIRDPERLARIRELSDRLYAERPSMGWLQIVEVITDDDLPWGVWRRYERRWP